MNVRDLVLQDNKSKDDESKNEATSTGKGVIHAIYELFQLKGTAAVGLWSVIINYYYS